MPLPTIYIYQTRGQCIVLLFAALRELGGSVTKHDAIELIAQRKWFAVELDDLKPYPSQTYREPRWHTLIAWARKDAALRDLILDHERDSWALSREGIRRWDVLRSNFASGERPVADGYLWSLAFKRYLCPTYMPAHSDAKRPWDLYKDLRDFTRLAEKYP